MKTLKKIITSFAIVGIVTSSSSVVFAQSYDELSGTSFVDTSGGSSWTNTDPSASIGYGNLGSDNTGYSWNDFNPYTPVSYNDLSNTSFPDASTNFGNVSCIGCATTQTPVYTPISNTGSVYTPISNTGSTYTPISNTASTYTPISNFGSIYTPISNTATVFTPITTTSYDIYNPVTSWYTTPVTTSVGYNYGYNTGYNYTTPMWNTTTIFGGGTTCNNAAGYYLSGSSCVKQCTNAASVIYPNQCPEPLLHPVTPIINCNSYPGYFYSNGQCIKQCSNNVTVTYPNTCPNPVPNQCDTTNGYYSNGAQCVKQCTNGTSVIFPNTCPTVTPLTCDNANGYYLSGNVCTKYCQSTNGYVTYPNQCPAPTQTCDIANGYYLNGAQCIKQCGNGVTAVYPNQCPTQQQCDTANGYYYNGSQCMKQCTNGTSVTYPNQCPVQQSCDTQNGYYLQNGVCIKSCPNGGTVTQPNQCPIIPPVVTCDNANGYYYTGSVCVKYCQSINGNVTYPNVCPNPTPAPTPQPTCDTYGGYYYSNGSCIKNCPNGGAVTQPNQCPIVTPTTTCDNGNGYYYNLTTCVKYCQSTNGYVTYPNQCPNPVPTPAPYYPVPVPNPVQTQVCYDGSVISAYAVCPSPYKVCPDGSFVSPNGYCPVVNYPAPQVAPVINNVITSIPTQIANTSARCNGIGLIPNNTPSVAWFEYGTSENLGAKTAVANIGTANTSPFTNLLTNLKPNTEYFCRAVMANSLGVVRGDIVHFVTKSKATYYPVATVKKTVKTTKKAKVSTPVSTVVTCSDGTTLPSSGTVNGTDAASMLEVGQKAMSFTLTKTKGDISPNSLASYFLAFKNESSSNLTDAKITLRLPEEMTLVNSNLGAYDARTHELTVAFPVMTPSQAGGIEIQVGIAKEAIIGKSIAVQAHASYVIPPKTSKGKALTDEVSAYAVSTITSAPLTQVEQPAKVKEVKKDAGTTAGNFLPNTIVEWVALFAILLIIIVLVRTIKESYEGKKSHH